MADLWGRCMCGSVTWTAKGPKTRNLICHCESCKRATSSPVTAFIGFDRDDVEWSGEINQFESSYQTWRGFCPACGTRLYFKFERWPTEIHVHAATLDKPDLYAPDQHVLWSERLPRVHVNDDLPKHEKGLQAAAKSGEKLL